MPILNKIDRSPVLRQLIPILLTSVTFILSSTIFYLSLSLINTNFQVRPVVLEIRLQDILIGATIYLKTSVDFAILMALFMKNNPGWRNRVAIEFGTGSGNALGTLVITVTWMFLKEVKLLLAGMIFLASLVLIELAGETVEQIQYWDRDTKVEQILHTVFTHTLTTLQDLLKTFRLDKIIPSLGMAADTKSSWLGLLWASFQVPFLLGLDDFAGYVPLLNVINLFGFGVAVIAAHAVLNTVLFTAPKRTTKFMENPLIAFAGGMFFLGLALYGFYEVFHLLATVHL